MARQTIEENRLSIKEAARILGTSAQFIRVGLQTGQLDFGYAVKNKSKWTYCIPIDKFEESTKIKVREASA